MSHFPDASRLLGNRFARFHSLKLMTSNLEEISNKKIDLTLESVKKPYIPASLSTYALNLWFLASFAHASACHKYVLKLQSGLKFWKPSFKRIHALKKESLGKRWRHFSSSQVPKDNRSETNGRSQHFPKSHSKQELLDLVDHYNEKFTVDCPPESACRKFHQPNSENNYTDYYKCIHKQSSILSVDLKTRETVQKLKVALDTNSENLDFIYELYRSLPHPRGEYLDSQTRHKLLHVLSVVEFKVEHSMLRYFSVFNEIKASGIPLTLSEWNSAISFIARYVRITTTSEVEIALRMWKEMEHSAGVIGDNVTFNVLFDVACRAEKFALAEIIYKEMESRGHKYTRYHYVTKIMFYGLRQDGDGVRATYRQLIEAGEIVDTVVLNAMISALIKAREPNAAENLYHRMKSDHLARANSPLAPKDFMSRRKVNKALLRATQLSKEDKEKRDKLQENSIIAPDDITYLILIEHFSVEVGDLEKTAAFLEEMKLFALPVRGVIFVKLFRGFFAHGGVPYTNWTGTRLELVYKSFLKVLDSGETDLFIGWWLVLWLLKAFEKCVDSSRALSVWEELNTRWEPKESDMTHLASVLDFFMSKVSSQRRNWYSRSSFTDIRKHVN